MNKLYAVSLSSLVTLLFAATNITAAIALHHGNSTFQGSGALDLWVDAIHGNDTNDGRTHTTAFRTIQKAANLASSGTTVHILSGIYRETVRPAMSGTAAERILYIAENGPGTAILRGAAPSASLAWEQLTANTIGLPPSVNPANIYYTDLSAWGLDSQPRFVIELDGEGKIIARLPLAYEPDWSVTTEWKYHEFWWAADGGSNVAGCNPLSDPSPRDCDSASRSSTQLTDRRNDADPPGVEPGNLTTLGDLTGATLVALDTVQGHYIFRRTIVAHDVSAGRVTVDEPCDYEGHPGLGWGSKYYVEGKPCLLDSPGEWWYDTSSRRLYLWPRSPGNPATMNIEIAWRDQGFSLKNRSYITLDGLSIQIFNQNAIFQENRANEKSYQNIVRNVTLSYANRGIWLVQDVQAGAPAGNVTDGFTLEDSEIGYMDTHAIYLFDWWEDNAAANSFSHSGVLNTIIRRNEMHHVGFRTDGENAIGLRFQFANRLRFEGNHVHHIAHNGVQFLKSVIQSPKEYGFAPSEIKTGEILIKDNVFEQACQLTTDCGALKFWGDPPDNHVFRDVLITGNVFRNTFGWTYVAEKRGRWSGGTGSPVQGMGGFGLYLDMVSGFHVYRNIAYNNAYAGFKFAGTWRDGDLVYYNNIIANSVYGFHFGDSSYDTHGNVNTQVVNNIVVNNEGYGVLLTDADGKYDHMTFDHNLYYSNGWGNRDYKPGDMTIYLSGSSSRHYQTLAQIQSNTDWEDHGIQGTPGFSDYDLADHDLDDESWPDFHLNLAGSNAIDRGTTNLPASLTALLSTFGVDDFRMGAAFDVGRYETDFAIIVSPSSAAVNPGGIAQYALCLNTPDLPDAVMLATVSPSPDLTVKLNSTLLTPGGVVTLTVTDKHAGTWLMPGVWHTIPITGTGNGLTLTGTAGLLVGGTRVRLPLITRH